MTAPAFPLLGETLAEFIARIDDHPAAAKAASWRDRNAAGREALHPRLAHFDRFRAIPARCGGRLATYAFSHWDRGLIVTRGGSVVAPGCVSSVNGRAVRLCGLCRGTGAEDFAFLAICPCPICRPAEPLPSLAR